RRAEETQEQGTGCRNAWQGSGGVVNDGEEINRERRQTAPEVCALGYLHSGETQEGCARARVHATEPGDRATGHPVDSRHGRQGAASGGDRARLGLEVAEAFKSSVWDLEP